MNIETKRVELLEANTANIEATFNKIKEFADAKGYRIINELKVPTNFIGMNKSIHFDSTKQKKVLRNYINRLDKKVNLQSANKFLHFLFKKIYKMDTCSSIELSEKEIAI